MEIKRPYTVSRTRPNHSIRGISHYTGQELAQFSHEKRSEPWTIRKSTELDRNGTIQPRNGMVQLGSSRFSLIQVGYCSHMIGEGFNVTFTITGMDFNTVPYHTVPASNQYGFRYQFNDL